MSLYAIGDLHLHFGTELRARNQLTDPMWKGHEERFRRYCMDMLKPEDTLVLLGDHSFGRSQEEVQPDMDYISALPGRKILLRGNHDTYWDAKKTNALAQRYSGLHFLQNNFFAYGDCALVGTKGFTFEGPYYLNRRGQIVDWDRDKEAHSRKIIDRELERLRISFDAAAAAGYSRFVMFLHFPPTNIMEESSGFTRMAEEYGAEAVYYAHCHGEKRFHDSLEGMHRGIFYRLVSGDCLRWIPYRIFD